MNGIGHKSIAGLLFLAAFFAFTQDVSAAQLPWPCDVPDFVPPKPGEHPRLLFRRSDLPALRARARTPEGKALIARLKTQLGGGEAMPQHKNPMTSAYGKKGGPKPGKELPMGAYSIYHAAGFGFLYQLTGDKKYADLGRQCFEWAFEGVRDRDREARYSWKQPGGALRAGPSLGWYALGYDLCYDGWDEATRQRIGQAILNYDEGKNQSLAELVRGSRHHPGSNHWGMQVGGGAMATLALMGDPGIDQEKIRKLLEDSKKAMIRNMTQGFGDGGFFAEGDGTGSMSSHIIFLTALQAWRNAGGKDFITPRPNAQWMALKWIFLTVPSGNKKNLRRDFPERGGYPHNIWARSGLSGGNYFGIGFGVLNDRQRAAMKWFYNNNLKAVDEAANAPFDTPSPLPHHSILSFVNWPWNLEPVDPDKVLPHAYRDTKWKFYAWRNEWKDENDIVISILTKTARGYGKAPGENTLKIRANGKNQTWGRINNSFQGPYEPTVDGSTVLQTGDGSWLAVDFSGASGAEAMLVMTGPGASGGKTVSAGGTTYHFLFPGGEANPQPDGNGVSIGKQKVSMEGGKLTLAHMAEPAEPLAADPEPRPLRDVPAPGEMPGISPPEASEADQGDVAAKPEPEKHKPPEEVVLKWEQKLLSRARDELKRKRRMRIGSGMPRFVTEIDAEGQTTIRMGPASFANAWDNVPPVTKRDIAIAIAKEGSAADHALAAFFCLLADYEEQAQRHLRSAGEEGEKVKALFEGGQ